ncbi:MAG: hypothetical protein QXN35_07270 [Ignisphaera sp.]
MKCLINLHNRCIVIERCLDARSVNSSIDCNQMINLYASEKFTKSYCSYCIKAVYAKAKKRLADKEVFVAL